MHACSFSSLQPNSLKGSSISAKPNASICDAGKKYHLHDPALSNTDLALHLTGKFLVIAGGDMSGEGRPSGTFWFMNAKGQERLFAFRIEDGEVVVTQAFHSHFVRQMLAIGDLVTEGSC